MQLRKLTYLLVSVALLVSASSVPGLGGDKDKDDAPPVTHQIQSFTFRNDTGMPVDGLVVTFDGRNVKTHNSDAFAKSSTTGKTITLSKAVISPGTLITIAFERDGAFQVVTWQWTANDTSVGGNRPGPPV